MRGLFLTTISLFLFGFSYPRTAEGANFLQIGYLNDGGSGFSCGDTDHNGLNEIYFQSSKDGFWRIYEHIGSNIYSVVYEFDNSTVPDRCPWVIGDLDGDSLSDVAGWWGLLVAVYESAAIDSYATNTVWKSNDTVDNWDTYITDLDQDGKKEILCATRVEDHIYLYECTGDNSYQLVFKTRPPTVGYTGGMAIGDFDKDGLMEMVKADDGGGDGIAEVYVYENTAVGVDSYAITHIDSIYTKNAYELASANDMDKDGWPEFIVGGKHNISPVGVQWEWLFTVFEATGNDTYQAKWSKSFISQPGIDKDGGVWTGDVDKDTTDEMVFSTGDTVYVYKCNGPDSYEEIWKYATETDNVICCVYDLNKNGYGEIVMSTRKSDGTLYDTRIYEDTPTGVEETAITKSQIPNPKFELFQNYPNPVVSTTEIRYQLPVSGSVSLKIYNVAGQLVKTLVNENQTAGSHSVTWDRKDNSGREVPAGVYFYRLTAGTLTETKKITVVR